VGEIALIPVLGVARHLCEHVSVRELTYGESRFSTGDVGGQCRAGVLVVKQDLFMQELKLETITSIHFCTFLCVLEWK